MIITDENYFSLEAENKYLGSTQVKRWQQCEAAAQAYLNGEYKYKMSTSMAVGQFVHKFVENDFDYNKTLMECQLTLIDLFTIKGAFKANANTRAIQSICDMILKDKLLMKLLSGEKEQILTGEIGGLEFKVKADVLIEKTKTFIDLKCMKSIREKMWVNGAWGTFIDKYDYIQQMAIYSEIIKQNKGETYSAALLVFSKEETPDKEMISFSQSLLDDKLEEVKETVEKIEKIKKKEMDVTPCGVCEYCRSNKKIERNIDFLEFRELVVCV